MILLLKITVTPVLMVAVSLAARRWGSAIGGLLAGLPLTAAPLSIYLALEQGRDFAARAAAGSVAGIAATTLFYLVYVAASRRRSLAVTVGLATLVFTAVMLALPLAQLPIAATILLDLGLIAGTLAACPAEPPAADGAASPAWDLPARVAASTGLVLTITGLAPILGPRLSGLLAPMPVIAVPLILIVHAQHGRAEAVAVIRGVLQAAFGVTAFLAIVGVLPPEQGLAETYAVALLASVLVTLPWFWARRLSF